MKIINFVEKYHFYIALFVTCIWMIINEFTADGVSHGPEDLPIFLVFCFLLINLVSLILYNFEATKPFAFTITFASITLIIIITFLIISIS
jgi:hypothetical protein